MAKNKLEIDVLVNDKGSANLNKVNEGLKETGQSAETSGKGFGKMAIGIGVAVGALTALVKISKEFIEVAQKQELAEKGLEIALKKQGDAAGEAFKSIKKLASSRQDVTAVGDEITLQFANILALGGQTGEQIEELVPTIQDLGAAYELAGKGTADYNKIATQVNKLIKEGVGDLSRFGIVLTDTEKKTIAAADETERQAIVMDKVSAAAGGMAEVLGNTSKGEMDQFNNVLGDVKENLGFLIIEGLKPIIKWVTKVMRALRDATDRGTKTAGMLATLVDIFTVMSEAVIAVNDILMDLWGLLGDITGAGNKAGSAMDFLKKAIRLVRLSILLLRAGAKGTVEALKSLKDTVVEFWDAITSLRFDKLGDILGRGAKKMKTSFEKGFKGVVDDFNESERKLAEGEGLAGAASGDLTSVQKKANDAFKIWKEAQDRRFTALGGNAKFQEELEKAIQQGRLDRIQELIDAEKKRQATFIEGQRNATQRQEALWEEEDKQEVKRGDKAEADAKARALLEQDILMRQFALASDVFGDTWEAKKAFAMSEAAIATALGVTEASPNVLLMALVGALGLAQIAKIAGEKKPSGFAEGGFTGTQGRSEVAGVVHGQEFVTNANATAQHRTGLELINAGISPEEAFNLQLPGNVPEQSGSNSIQLSGQFVIDGNDLVLKVVDTIQQQRTGTM